MPEPEELRTALDRALNRQNEDKPREFMAFAEHFIRTAEDRIQSGSGQKLARGTVRKYRSGLNALLEYAKLRNRVLSFAGMDMDFYDGFMRFLTVTKKLAPNTVGVRIKTLKVFLNAATEEGINTNRTFQNRKFRAPVEITDKVYLNEVELNDLYHVDSFLQQALGSRA
ncbi:MAG: phage integrase SAM-like domain-containing protein [Flavobacteriales bacterium]